MAKGPVEWVAWILLVVGGLNWGLVGLGVGDLVDMVFGTGTMLAQVVYLLVGLSALFTIVKVATCKKCNP